MRLGVASVRLPDERASSFSRSVAPLVRQTLCRPTALQKCALLAKIPKIHAAQILCTLYIVTLYIVLFSVFSNPLGIFS